MPDVQQTKQKKQKTPGYAADAHRSGNNPVVAALEKKITIILINGDTRQHYILV